MLKYTDITRISISKVDRLRRLWPEKRGGFLRFQILQTAQLTHRDSAAHVLETGMQQ
jgi:hypothetical protein